ncbi:MAG: ATP-binding protein [Chloracidobacterium sp.]|nr:ATP-binding protein [Chloracidobacterium sp.]MDW8218798.1 ATP-binding protein [Acidobacteriota bacterium]
MGSPLSSVSPEVWAAVFQRLNLPMMMIDYETRRVTAVNEAFLAESEYTADELVGQETKQLSFLPFGADRERLYTELARSGQVSTTILAKLPDGGIGEAAVWMFLIEADARRYVLLVPERVTYLQNNSEQVGQRLRDVLAVAPGVIYQYRYDATGKGRFTYMSGKAEALFGLSAATIAADEALFWRQVPYEYRRRVRDTFAAAAETGSPWECEFPFRHVITGEERWFQVIAFPKVLPDGGALWTGFASDITELHRLRTAREEAYRLLEEERLRKNKLESLGTLAGGIAHDFNNLLAVLTGNLGLIKRDPSLSAENQRRLEAIERATERAKLLAKQLLTFAKGGDPVLETVSPETFVVAPMQDILDARGVEVVFESAPALWLTRGDKGQLMQVFQNLAVNAADAMPMGGRVHVRLQNCTLAEHEVPGLSPGDYVCISVTDTGCGIAPEHLSRIFDPYFTTKSGGHGLGLAVGYSIIAKHGGQIRVTSTVGVGTRFDVYLPAKKTTEATVESVVLTREVAAGLLRRRLLVMDDDELMRDMFGTALETFGYGVVTCRHGEEAIERYCAARDAGQSFLGVILDLRVAGGLGGKETLERLRELDPNVTAIVCSGYHDDRVMANHRAYGFTAKLPKPFDIAELGQLLDQLFGPLDAA